MYVATIKAKVDIIKAATPAELKADPETLEYLKPHDVEIVLKSDNRNYLRNLELICQENGLPCVTVVEQAPRVVKFKGLE